MAAVDLDANESCHFGSTCRRQVLCQSHDLILLVCCMFHKSKVRILGVFFHVIDKEMDAGSWPFVSKTNLCLCA